MKEEFDKAREAVLAKYPGLKAGDAVELNGSSRFRDWLSFFTFKGLMGFKDGKYEVKEEFFSYEWTEQLGFEHK